MCGCAYVYKGCNLLIWPHIASQPTWKIAPMAMAKRAFAAKNSHYEGLWPWFDGPVYHAEKGEFLKEMPF